MFNVVIEIYINSSIRIQNNTFNLINRIYISLYSLKHVKLFTITIYYIMYD